MCVEFCGYLHRFNPYRLLESLKIHDKGLDYMYKIASSSDVYHLFFASSFVNKLFV